MNTNATYKLYNTKQTPSRGSDQGMVKPSNPFTERNVTEPEPPVFSSTVRVQDLERVGTEVAFVADPVVNDGTSMVLRSALSRIRAGSTTNLSGQAGLNSSSATQVQRAFRILLAF